MEERTQEPLTGTSISSAIECLLHTQDANDSDMVKAIDVAVKALKLLKAQEPMQIIKVGYYDHGKCPKCDMYVSRYSNFCWYCGQAVKWE